MGSSAHDSKPTEGSSGAIGKLHASVMLSRTITELCESTVSGGSISGGTGIGFVLERRVFFSLV